MEENNDILNKWEQLKSAVSDLEVDVTKNARGVFAAGVRTRKGLRNLGKLCGALVKETIAFDRQNKESRPKKEGRKPFPKKK